MPKHGILHDYDLWANKEASAENQFAVRAQCHSSGVTTLVKPCAQTAAVPTS